MQRRPIFEFSSLSLNSVWTLWTFLELGAIWLWAFGVDFLKDFWGLLIQSGPGAEKLNDGFFATSQVSPVISLHIAFYSPPPDIHTTPPLPPLHPPSGLKLGVIEIKDKEMEGKK